MKAAFLRQMILPLSPLLTDMSRCGMSLTGFSRGSPPQSSVCVSALSQMTLIILTAKDRLSSAATPPILCVDVLLRLLFPMTGGRLRCAAIRFSSPNMPPAAVAAAAWPDGMAYRQDGSLRRMSSVMSWPC